MNFQVSEQAAKERVEHLLQCIHAFVQLKRGVPSRILTELCRLHSHWQGRDDIPDVVVAAHERFGRIVRFPKKAEGQA